MTGVVPARRTPETERTPVRHAAPRPLRRLAVDRRLRWLATGGAAYGVYNGAFATMWLLSRGRVPYLATALAANAVTALLVYPAYRWVFSWNGSWIAGFRRFYLVSLWSLAVVVIGLPLLVEVFQVPVLPAQAAVLSVAPLVTYRLHRMWAFRRRAV